MGQDTTVVLLVALTEAQDTIRQYRAYAESMRDIGRGFEPTGTVGQRPGSVDAEIASALALARGEVQP